MRKADYENAFTKNENAFTKKKLSNQIMQILINIIKYDEI